MNNFFLQYGWILYLIQLFFAVVIGLYFWNLLKSQQTRKSVNWRESEKEQAKLKELRSIHLTEPLSSLSRPGNFNDVVGQEEGISILRSALCGPNPQHVIIYGPPGVGKTAAARLVLEEAKKTHLSPFKEDAHFIEVDATICRFDERNIADPLIGSVHDPIYQGAGSMGAAGIPQPKPGACTRAHGGILFIDEIGELHPIQLNKLLKVLEDRKVILESAYYSETDHNIPSHIHDIFQKGLPADFRLIGATTRAPQELPPALRSRCMEIYFKPLEKESIKKISRRAAEKINFILEDDIVDEISRYANNGREAVNIVQLAAGIAMMEKSSSITAEIIQKVINNGRFSPRPEVKIKSAPAVGIVNGLAVTGANTGVIMEVEAMVMKAAAGTGQLTVTGVIDEEQVGGAERQYRRKSMARSAVENVMTVLASRYQLPIKDYDVHINFPGGIPIDGPSAGITMATAIYSAVHEIPIHHQLAMTGEISVYGMIKPVGGVISKLEAARAAGVKHVLIPADNYMDIFSSFPDIEVTPVHSLDEVFSSALVQ
ncbi:MAG TPA: ATP-dependent protease LonB [Syntrophomonadaceae bacterium]|nr:ATP-dependent protease LonB [Syntrophomonadaceae bacterium]